MRQVIDQNLSALDEVTASLEITKLLCETQTEAHDHILLECTNLPPYRAAITQETGLPVTDILTCIEQTCAGAIAPAFS